jgi:uncharacterized integral membrane protein
MSFKLLFRAIVFLLILFVILYMGMNNTGSIAFSFPIVFEKGITAPAALIYFAIFAIGVVAGTMLSFGSGSKKSADKSARK